jgi:hypothetical protein
MAGEDLSQRELALALEGVRQGQRDTVSNMLKLQEGLHGIELAMARLEEQFRAHVQAQTRRTERRDTRCLEHLGLIREQGGLIRGLDDRVGTVEGLQAADTAVVVESRRSWASIVQALATAGTVAGVGVALWRS